MIREYEINPEVLENPHASLWRFSNSPLAPTEQEQYDWALGDYFRDIEENGVVFPSYATKGYLDLNAVNKAGHEVSKNGGWLTKPLLKIMGEADELTRQKQAHQVYKIPVVNNTMERVRQDLEKKIHGNLREAIINKQLEVSQSDPSLRNYIKERSAERYPLENQLIDRYLRNRFGN